MLYYSYLFCVVVITQTIDIFPVKRISHKMSSWSPSQKKKKKKAHVLSSLLFLLASGTILMPLVCIEQGMHPLEGVQDGVSQPHHCEGASVWRVGCTHKAHENLSGFGGVHLCQGQTTAVGDWLQSTRADQIGKYFRNNEKYQQRRKLKYWERENYN